MIGLPAEVVRRLGAARIDAVEVHAVTGSSGAATEAVDRLTVTFADERGGIRMRRIVRKTLRPLDTGRHARAARSPAHWAWWRRELLAYPSGLLPTAPGLAAPALLGVDGDTLYLAEIDAPVAAPLAAAEHFGQWQASTTLPEAPWLARDQLADRVAASDLDWGTVDADSRWARIWGRREELLDRISRAPLTVVHGDFSAGNLFAPDDRTTTAIDWAAFGVGALGADLVALTLNTLTDPLDAYLRGLDGRFAPGEVESAYRAALQLSAAGRVHWMLERGDPVPEEFDALVPED